MPPLSAYTPFESLLFFQSLAALDSRPTNFVSISNVLRNNPFIRQNGTFDAGRLAPEALEELYTTLMRDGANSTEIHSLEPNGHHVESNGTNPKKRKISSPRPDRLVDKGMTHAAIIPDLVSHLYARYKELVTREIWNEEVRYREINDEIERLQKEDREASKDPGPVIHKRTPQAPEGKPEPAPEPMDVDTKEERAVQTPLKDVGQPQVELAPGIDIKQPQVKLQRKDVDVPKLPMVPTAQPAPVQPQRVPTQPVGQPYTAQAPAQVQLQLTPTSQPPQPIPQTTPRRLQPQGLNEKPAATPKQPDLAPRALHVSQGPMNVPAARNPLPSPASAAGAGVAPGAPATPSQVPQNTNIPGISPTPRKPVSTAKPAGKEGPSKAVPATAPHPPRPSFQQWSLNPSPRTPRPTSSQPTPDPLGQATIGKPFPSHPHQPLPKSETKATHQTQPTAAPSTPRPISTAVQLPAPSGDGTGYETPIGPAQALLFSDAKSSRPRLSITTPGSLTPWKKTPRLSIPQSPRSPERPRPEDVSPISEKAPSLMASREATPEDPRPPRKRARNEGKGSGRGREPGLAGANIDSKGGLKPKAERQTLSVGKGRDRSAASSRSRGRSVLSRDEEPESVFPGRIKHEMPSTPAGISETAEPEHRPSSGRKGPAVSEDRPGRGRPKRKRCVSEVLEVETLPTEISQLNRIDPNQSTSYVLCARNFPRTGAPIMNDVTTHKHASIFTKPLTERDAPGYRGLIYRPQDLKSIKSSIHQGSRALAVATEAANTPAADGESPAPNAGTPSKNAVLMLQKSEEVIPPKAIVNSAQLEKELIRMFANAIMFNPVPQRGFGPAFPMTSDGGSRENTRIPEIDEGGIINDTIEMFEDVEQAVTRWRAAERTADELASKSILSLRRGSVSDLNTDSADDVKA
ncbi:hypothetical protein BDV28DRAFT_134704 [Aspergillus coremiiformis]|uniref:Bromo domain-containing protein n=1 Tax=Aspergillus coremiiformis TaxID=138285 RepID=A0A5N6Z4R6_9EURO|nr:hypothetical protein BDV28DRAFT_134704 [Aspergillus coremiiformis]